jgi:lathosterol oxidase
MLCEISEYYGSSLLSIWMTANLTMFPILMLTSGPVFYLYYWPSNITYEKWKYKTNPKFPSPEKVRDEIIQMLKGMCCSTICPSISIYLAQTNSPYTQALCGWGGYSWQYHVAVFVGVWIFSDLYEFLYHRLGHVDVRFWQNHKHHHIFFNPSPFAVIADEWIDQFARSAPLLFIPMLIPINMDALFLQFGLMFYVYGVYLHWGYESPRLSAHHKYINTSFQHYAHHAKSLMNKPYHCGFFFKIWDQIFQCTWEKACFCAECSIAKGERTLEAFQKIEIPDYSKLFTAKLWLEASYSKIAVKLNTD